jgi:hypothetical protein
MPHITVYVQVVKHTQQTMAHRPWRTDGAQMVHRPSRTDGAQTMPHGWPHTRKCLQQCRRWEKWPIVTNETSRQEHSPYCVSWKIFLPPSHSRRPAASRMSKPAPPYLCLVPCPMCSETTRHRQVREWRCTKRMTRPQPSSELASLVAILSSQRRV